MDRDGLVLDLLDLPGLWSTIQLFDIDVICVMSNLFSRGNYCAVRQKRGQDLGHVLAHPRGRRARELQKQNVMPHAMISIPIIHRVSFLSDPITSRFLHLWGVLFPAVHIPANRSKRTAQDLRHL